MIRAFARGRGLSPLKNNPHAARRRDVTPGNGSRMRIGVAAPSHCQSTLTEMPSSTPGRRRTRRRRAVRSPAGWCVSSLQPARGGLSTASAGERTSAWSGASIGRSDLRRAGGLLRRLHTTKSEDVDRGLEIVRPGAISLDSLTGQRPHSDSWCPRHPPGQMQRGCRHRPPIPDLPQSSRCCRRASR